MGHDRRIKELRSRIEYCWRYPTKKNKRPWPFRLTETEYSAAKREAERLGISLAELLRRSLRTMIPADEAKPYGDAGMQMLVLHRYPAGSG
ncbi:MAG: hypothetical protein ACREVH_02555 [Gammaproteobacteria bacterium]